MIRDPNTSGSNKHKKTKSSILNAFYAQLTAWNWNKKDDENSLDLTRIIPKFILKKKGTSEWIENSSKRLVKRYP